MTLGIVLAIWLVGVGMLLAELILPGGIVGAIGAVVVTGAVVAAFVTQGAGWGGALLVASVAAAAGMIVYGARNLTHSHTMTTQDGFIGADDKSDLVGSVGVAATVLRPGGFATIGGRRVDVVTRGELLDAGTPVEVVSVEGNTVVVRAAEPSA